MTFLNGYKTILGAIAMIGSGVAIAAQAISNGDFAHLPEGIAAIGAGLGMLGIRFAQKA